MKMEASTIRSFHTILRPEFLHMGSALGKMLFGVATHSMCTLS